MALGQPAVRLDDANPEHLSQATDADQAAAICLDGEGFPSHLFKRVSQFRLELGENRFRNVNCDLHDMLW